ILPFAGFCSIMLFLIIKIWHLKKQQIKISTGKKIDNVSFSLSVLFGFIFIIWLFENLKPAFQLSISILPEMVTKVIIQHRFLKISGALLIFISLILWIITLHHFKNSLRFGLDEKNQGNLITSGIFSISRNPFFLSLDIYFLGIAFIFPNLFFICFAVLAISSIHFFILKEEKFLAKVYGVVYEKYAKNVGRYF
ncbi:MAG: isoprenylcysteine carboxylmethyltransferase family protein, partial [Prolixibacteraceae bacterium]|nr:isoprenylcysteine carboxylmethyltransferase family protein [Prolixibacteraceae bacterium]